MRYIGCKERIIEHIDGVVSDYCFDGYGGVFCDIFAGTGTVGSHFKDRFKIIANDYLFSSYAINSAFIINNRIPFFSKVKKTFGITDVFDYLENAKIPERVSNNFFICKNYSDFETNSRLYLTTENAKRIDYIRSTIDDWKKDGLINDKEFLYLIGCLVFSVPSISNVTGTYGAFLKYWDKRCFKKFEFQRILPVNNGLINKTYNDDALKLIKRLRGDVLYIDPPYNSRDYLSNYHLLETVARNDQPNIVGVTGTRESNGQKSLFCSSKHVFEAMDTLVSDAAFRHIIISYNSEGLLSKEQILSILKRHCIEDSVVCREIDFKRYQSKKTDSSKMVTEYIFYGKKDIPLLQKKTCLSKSNKPIKTTKYVKSPTNYIGGKWRLLDQLIPLFPKNISTFVDLFSGGMNVSANVDAKKVHVNDINYKVIDMFRAIIDTPAEDLLAQIESRIKEFGLNKTDKKAFRRFRDYYNTYRNPIDLFTLSCFSFNYQFRFNSRGEYNNPFGKNRSCYSKETEKKLISFKQRMEGKKIVFSSVDFRLFDLNKLEPYSFIYCDPPYLLTTGSYNDGKRCFGDWLEKDEEDLLSFLDRANMMGIRFALSEITVKGSERNTALIKWSKKYFVHKINSNYSNCNYQIKGDNLYTEEVLITNYAL
ncbi:Dam family site-specific DNA-(adenine-N6)-methyltransferase [Candidatus Saccharibacteria bacterium]|nr:Dam family site-specific DNA-(adenine-N6)-methyltransferase [Candidatus Saccharibacteria bacterium]